MQARKFIKSTVLKSTHGIVNEYHPHITRYVATDETNPLMAFYVCQSAKKDSIRFLLEYSEISPQDGFKEKYKAAFSLSPSFGSTENFSRVVTIDEQGGWIKFINIMKEVYQIDPETEQELLAVKFLVDVKFEQLLALIPDHFADALQLAQVACDPGFVFRLGQHCKDFFMSQLLPTEAVKPVFHTNYLQMAMACFEEIPKGHQDFQAARAAGYELLALDVIKDSDAYENKYEYLEDLFRFAVEAGVRKYFIDAIYRDLCGATGSPVVANVAPDVETLIAAAQQTRRLQEENKELKAEIERLRQAASVEKSSSGSPVLFKKSF